LNAYGWGFPYGLALWDWTDRLCRRRKRRHCLGNHRGLAPAGGGEIIVRKCTAMVFLNQTVHPSVLKVGAVDGLHAWKGQCGIGFSHLARTLATNITPGKLKKKRRGLRGGRCCRGRLGRHSHRWTSTCCVDHLLVGTALLGIIEWVHLNVGQILAIYFVWPARNGHVAIQRLLTVGTSHVRNSFWSVGCWLKSAGRTMGRCNRRRRRWSLGLTVACFGSKQW
jgi:hypothetical protein